MLFIILIAGSVFAYKVYKNGGGMSGMLATVVGHDENTKKNLGEFKCLILGISTDQENVDLTDTIMVASYNPNTQKLHYYLFQGIHILEKPQLKQQLMKNKCIV